MDKTAAGLSDTVPDIQPLLARALQLLCQRFAEELVSVVLYGSYARGEATMDSDIDLIMVVRHLPHEWSEVFALEDELVRKGQEADMRLDVRLLEPEAVSYSVTWAAPLMLEIYDAHRIIHDPTGFFLAEMTRFAQVAHDRGIYKVARGVWRVPSYVLDTLAQHLASQHGFQL